MEDNELLTMLSKVTDQSLHQGAEQVKANARFTAAIEQLAASINKLADAITVLRSGPPPEG